jgi:hypothetical protein
MITVIPRLLDRPRPDRRSVTPLSVRLVMFLSVIYRYVCRRIAGDFWKNGRVPPLLQMIYGRPQLEFAADEFTGPDSKANS